jgi:fucose permease
MSTNEAKTENEDQENKQLLGNQQKEDLEQQKNKDNENNRSNTSIMDGLNNTFTQIFNNEKKEEQVENRLEEILNSTSFGFQQFKVLFILFIYAFAEGFSMLANSLVVPILEKKWNIGQVEKGFMGGSIFLGFMTGAVIVGQISDHYGRKKAFVIGCCISLLGSIGGVFIQSAVQYILTNIIIGIGIGISVPSAITLVSEISNPFIRARIIGLMWCMFPTGEIVGCVLAKNYQTYDYHSENWVVLHISRCIAVIILLINQFTFTVSNRYHTLIYNSRKS